MTVLDGRASGLRRARVERLQDLREPPVVGGYYLVPVITYPLRGMMADWPVLGPMHEDAEHIGFPWLHYHIDGRFLNARQYRHMANQAWPKGDHDRALNGLPIMSPRGMPDTLPRRPHLKRRQCRRTIQRWAVAQETKRWGLQEAYGGEVHALRLPDGRALCPHRKVDLSQFPADEQGLVTCPLHGLRVCVQSKARADV